MREARIPTDQELQQLTMFVAEEVGEDIAKFMVREAEFIAVFEGYRTHYTRLPKKVMLVVWDELKQYQLFSWTEGPMCEVEVPILDPY